VRKWLRAKPDFVAQYARARQEQADHYADEIIEIADDQSIDPNARRVQIEARKWIACKLKPKAYGDRADVTLSGALEIRRIENVIVDPVSDDS
jgi:hypothetical protein